MTAGEKNKWQRTRQIMLTKRRQGTDKKIKKKKMKPQQRFHIDDFIRNFKQKANNNNFNAIAQKEDRQKRDMLSLIHI